MRNTSLTSKPKGGSTGGMDSSSTINRTIICPNTESIKPNDTIKVGMKRKLELINVHKAIKITPFKKTAVNSDRVSWKIKSPLWGKRKRKDNHADNDNEILKNNSIQVFEIINVEEKSDTKKKRPAFSSYLPRRKRKKYENEDRINTKVPHTFDSCLKSVSSSSYSSSASYESDFAYDLNADDFVKEGKKPNKKAETEKAEGTKMKGKENKTKVSLEAIKNREIPTDYESGFEFLHDSRIKKKENYFNSLQDPRLKMTSFPGGVIESQKLTPDLDTLFQWERSFNTLDSDLDMDFVPEDLKERVSHTTPNPKKSKLEENTLVNDSYSSLILPINIDTNIEWKNQCRNPMIHVFYVVANEENKSLLRDLDCCSTFASTKTTTTSSTAATTPILASSFEAVSPREETKKGFVRWIVSSVCSYFFILMIHFILSTIIRRGTMK